MKCSECVDYTECSKKHNLAIKRKRCHMAKVEYMQTNADHIRAKIDTNEKLAKVIMDCGIDEHLNFCKELPECEACDYDIENPAVDCMRCLAEWLGQPAEVRSDG